MDLLLKMIHMILGVASPELRKMLVDWVNEFEKKAAATPNPWDDILAKLLKAVIAG